jgi:hypothetical protein
MPQQPNVNRIVEMVRAREVLIAERLAASIVTQDQVDSLCRSLDMDAMEHCRFQELKSLAFLGGNLMLEEGQLVHEYLGPSADVFNGQPIAVKAVLTQLFEELLAMAMKRGAGASPA